jgi:hypothetical protein
VLRLVTPKPVLFISQLYRGIIPKPGGILGYNIITIPNPHLGLKRRSGTFGSISDLNVGLVQ